MVKCLTMALSLATAVACNPPMPTAPPSPDDVAMALDIVAQRYRTPGGPPVIHWVMGTQCLTLPWDEPNIPCADGYTLDSTGEITIAWWSGRLSSSALAHELYHRHQRWIYGHSDNEHRGRGWSILVPDAEADLRSAGL